MSNPISKKSNSAVLLPHVHLDCPAAAEIADEIPARARAEFELR
ncbi:hypothetical protein Holit_03046 [Hollandina sp. SP2]